MKIIKTNQLATITFCQGNFRSVGEIPSLTWYEEAYAYLKMDLNNQIVSAVYEKELLMGNDPHTGQDAVTILVEGMGSEILHNCIEMGLDVIENDLFDLDKLLFKGEKHAPIVEIVQGNTHKFYVLVWDDEKSINL